MHEDIWIQIYDHNGRKRNLWLKSTISFHKNHTTNCQYKLRYSFFFSIGLSVVNTNFKVFGSTTTIITTVKSFTILLWVHILKYLTVFTRILRFKHFWVKYAICLFSDKGLGVLESVFKFFHLRHKFLYMRHFSGSASFRC